MNATDYLPASWQLAEFNARLSDIAQGPPAAAAHPGEAAEERRDSPDCTGMSLADLARSLYAERRLRERSFGSDMFGEPAWDLLLDVFVHGLQGKEMLVSSACIGAACPPSTALRYITLLLDAGLLQSRRDSTDKRRRLLSPTARAVDHMSAYLSAVASRRCLVPGVKAIR
ncbi:MarR family transcriptional regulator [Sphingomonas quercus]|uniref:MarR family transcriptional regulator n=1 Tax=Sphingomonas quercus TaxID=2842451 RepID=A0ABS6BDN0_9SPHN|nr:MarR family transcriptional regulator [Sphingomonas quercus]MBU3076427.1 MarR family transcriptional regulator [Sphingomonas quercus]